MMISNAGLSTEWRLSGYVGFIVNLALACVIGFQAPVVTILCLRMVLHLGIRQFNIVDTYGLPHLFRCVLIASRSAIAILSCYAGSYSV